jgi:glycine cleavage system H protein
MSRRFTPDHEWVSLDEETATATVGITAHAQEALGDLVFVELPKVGRHVIAGEAVAVVESVKAASDIYAPLGGRIAAVNTALVEDPTLANRSPEEDGWFFRIEGVAPVAFEELLDEAAYQAVLAEQA